MPADSTPRILAAFSVSTFPVRASTRRAPTLAKATFCPAAMLGAPHTTVSLLAFQADRRQPQAVRVWDAGRRWLTYPTKTLSQEPPTTSMLPTSVPDIVSRWANSAGGRSISTYSLSQDKGIFIADYSLPGLGN